MGLGMKVVEGWDEEDLYEVGDTRRTSSIGAVVRAAAEVGDFWDTLNKGLGAGIEIYQQRETRKAAQRAGAESERAYAAMMMQRASVAPPPVNPYIGPHVMGGNVSRGEGGGGGMSPMILLGGAALLAVVLLK